MNYFDIDRLLSLLTYNPQEPMIFSSGLFLFLFLFFSGIYASLKRYSTLRILFVTLFSYYFYYKSSGIYFLLLAFVTTSDFFIASRLHKTETPWLRRLLVTLSVSIDLLLLGYFKYTNFFGALCFADWIYQDIFLPVGISFFTFQSLSYTIDIFRKKITPLDSLLDYAFYVSFFPQLVAGPIVRASDFIPQIRRPLKITNEMFGNGLFLIMAGLFKKAVISDYISVNFVERVFNDPGLYSGMENLLAVYGYALQIYCDFSGYSDMAIGIALLLGFQFPKNFDNPYRSHNITEFWRRWHISLSSWLKDYLYISLGGNRKGKLRQYINLMLTMLLGGLWHGASLNFILWGGLHGLYLCIDKMLYPYLYGEGRSKLIRTLQVVFTFHLVAATWVLFRAQTFETAQTVFTQIGTQMHASVIWQWVESYWAVALLMVVGYMLHFTPESLTSRVRNIIIRCPLLVQVLLLVGLIFIVIQVKSSDVQPFIYFQF